MRVLLASTDPSAAARSSHARANLLILALAPIFLDIGFLQVVISAWLPTIGFTPFQVGLLITIQGILVAFFVFFIASKRYANAMSAPSAQASG